MKKVIEVQNLYKEYRLGVFGYRTFKEDLKNWWRNITHTESHERFDNQTEHIQNKKKVLALDNISFDIAEGERIGIIGENGAGKSTLLKILSRITTPTNGKVKIKGRIASLLEVGTGFHPELTGMENIYLNGAIYGLSSKEIDRKLDQIIDFSGVEKYIDTPVKRYSSGMYVRLGFAVAAYLEPDILLIDEILAVGDAEFQKKCLGKMKTLGGQGRTVIFVSHNMTAVENLCDKVFVLIKGKLKFIGSQKEAISYYSSNMSKKISGEIKWDEKDKAPGDDRVKLKAIRILSEGKINPKPEIDKDITIQIEYWNEVPGKRWVGFHLMNSLGHLVCTPSNASEFTIKPDYWYDKISPAGEFRSTCTIPGSLLNTEQYSISLIINGSSSVDNIILVNNVLSFKVVENTSKINSHYSEIIGVIRPRLEWNTEMSAKDIIN